jgi:starch phosphorylase
MNTDQKSNTAWFESFKQSEPYSKLKQNPIAYFCAEFALVENLPSYAGGLGILAGDYVLETAEQDFPLVGIGLYYQKSQNNQNETSEPDGTKFTLELLKSGPDKLLITIPIEDRDVQAQVWKWQKKNSCVYFLDTNINENTPTDRLITEQLYAEDREIRLKQELILGIGGVRLLQKLQIFPSVYHLNEGHSAFLIIELLGQEVKNGLNIGEAFTKIKERLIFTNHTLVLEGQEMFTPEALTRNTRKLCQELNLDILNIIEKGRAKSEDNMFSMTTLALNSARLTNAVSRIHGEKARELWSQYPIIHITNGIFIPRWDRIKSEDIVAEHMKNEENLLKIIRQTHGEHWKKEALLVGWSRRFVPYKRPLALLEDVSKLEEILKLFKNKIHFVYSAPLDDNDVNKNEFLKKIAELMNGELKGFLTFIPHYNIKVAEAMVAGCDVWLNTPIVGREACGTSGMKAALNGTIPVSTNDGWVCEIPLNDFGWLINDQNITTDLLEKLKNEIIPTYETFLHNKLSSDWLDKMKKSRNLILTDFSTARMLREYIEKMY